jgi:uncharacterized protein YbjQ (UPF0145 family)
MIITTTPSIQGKEIREYLGVVMGEAIMGANVFKDLFASISDIIGGRAGAYEQELRKARKIAIEEMSVEARELGGNAIVGVDIDYEVIRDGMLMVARPEQPLKSKVEFLTV